MNPPVQYEHFPMITLPNPLKSDYLGQQWVGFK
jgi:hypothetical protein